MYSRVGDINMLEVRRKLNAIGSNGIISNCLHHTGLGLKAIGLVLDDRRRTEVLPVTVWYVCEPKIAGYGMLSNIVDGGEVAAEEVVDQDLTFVGCWVYENQLGRVGQVAFVTKDDLLAFAAVSVRADGVPGSSSIGFSQMLVMVRLDAVVAIDIDTRNIDWVAEATIPVAGGIELPGLDIVDAGFVESLVVLITNQLLRNIGS